MGAASPDRPPIGTLVAYAVPSAAFSFALFYVQFYFLKFATDVLLLAPAAVGALLGAGRIWDAVSDPLAGHWSDRTRSRLGRRRPWMLVGTPLVPAFLVMLWTPPAGLGEGALLVWCGVALFGFYTAYTIYSVPHQSLGAELVQGHHGRSSVFGAARAWMIVMLLGVFGLLTWQLWPTLSGVFGR